MATANLGNDLELAQIDFQRKQALADALRKQSMESMQGQMIGRRYVAPSFTQGLAKLMQGDQANNLDRMNTEELRNARQAYDTRSQGEMQNFMSAMRGTPAVLEAPLTPRDDEGNVNPAIKAPAVAPDQAKALALALQSKNPMLQSMGGEIFKSQFAPKDSLFGKIDAKDYTPQSLQRFVAAGGRDYSLLESRDKAHFTDEGNAIVPRNPYTGAPLGSSIPKQVSPEFLGVSGNTAATIANTSQQGALNRGVTMRGQNMQDARENLVPLETPTGYQAFSKKTGSAVPIMSGGQQLQQKDSPLVANQKLQGQLGAGIEEARKLIPIATASGAGALADTAMGFVGKSTKGGDAAQQLETLAGWMTSNVPRMQGPQSDKDVLLYKTMAAEVGNRNKPVSARMAALDTLEKLQAKYADVNAIANNMSPTKANTAKQGGAKFLGFE